jgi:acetolactate synthase-1/3 small subunit
MKHTLIAVVQDEPLILSRVVGLLTRRGFTIEGLAVGASEGGVRRFTLVVDAVAVDQVVKQLERLVPVLCVQHNHQPGRNNGRTVLRQGC